MDICVPEMIPGQGGVGGGEGLNGQPSQAADGHAAQAYGIPVIHLTTGMTAQFDLLLTRDTLGTIPADLSEITDIQFLCLSTGQNGKALFQVPCESLGEGRIRLKFTPKEDNYRPGLHYAEIHCLKDEELRHVFRCCLEIQKSFAGSKFNGFYPLSIAEVRMALYDTSGRQNELLNDLEFSDVVIARCMHRAVEDWNEMPPALSKNFTVSSFPFRSNLCVGACGYIFQMAANRYIRNQMRHSNAGLTFDDNDKGPLYLQLAENSLNQWKQWVQAKKNELNLLECMGTISDVYLDSAQPWWTS